MRLLLPETDEIAFVDGDLFRLAVDLNDESVPRGRIDEKDGLVDLPEIDDVVFGIEERGRPFQ